MVSGGNRDVKGNVDGRNVNNKVMNEKFKAAEDLMRSQPPKYDQAIAILTEATQMAPDQDAAWYRLGVAYLGSANAQDDAAEKTKLSTEAYNDLEKAIDLLQQRKSQLSHESSKSPCNIEGVCAHVVTVKGAFSDNYKLAVYYSNLGEAAARLGKNDEARKDFQQAAQTDPANAASYYFNEGIILRNAANTVDERKQAVDAFDKSMAADPTKAAAYYLKGELQFGIATADNEGKMIPPPGTVEALQKYLELQPEGPYAQRARRLLEMLESSKSTGTKN